jgi:hypothetical protein
MKWKEKRRHEKEGRLKMRKGVPDIGIGLGRALEEGTAPLLRRHLALAGGNLALGLQVALVANEDLRRKVSQGKIEIKRR